MSPVVSAVVAMSAAAFLGALVMVVSALRMSKRHERFLFNMRTLQWRHSDVLRALQEQEMTDHPQMHATREYADGMAYAARVLGVPITR